MTSLAISFALVLALAAAVSVVLYRVKSSDPDPVRFPFERCRPLSQREQVLYWRLRKVLPDQIVLSQVALSRVLRVEKGHNFRRWINRIDRMTVDFLICLPDATIIAAIELDDSSHDRDGRFAIDAKKDKALGSAGIKLLRYREVPPEDELRSVFLG